jgi:hypothetical protein
MQTTRELLRPYVDADHDRSLPSVILAWYSAPLWDSESAQRVASAAYQEARTWVDAASARRMELRLSHPRNAEFWRNQVREAEARASTYAAIYDIIRTSAERPF